MAPTQQLVVLVASTSGIGMLMALAGVQKSALEWKRRKRLCPSCGHAIRGRACTRH